MKVLVVGGGGREHAIVHRLSQSKRIEKLYCAPGNGGIAQLAKCVDIKATDIDGVVNFSVQNSIDFVVVAPDDPLVLGMVDALNAKGIKTFGPNKKAAIIEGSKVYSKELMKKYNIPTAGYEVFDDAERAIEYIKQNNTYPIVVKADGLALGKGVIIPESFEAAVEAVNSIMNDRVFGDSGNKVVIEEFLTGPEVSVLSFTDGKTIIPMVSSMDHKRAYDGDKGPNTGGMGTIAPNPFYTDKVAKECLERIFIPTMNALNSEGRTFTGCIFFGIMLTPNGAKTIEYNCRFGDPETQVVISLLDSDLFDIFTAISEGRLSEAKVEWQDKHAACVVVASGGYPVSYKSGYKISGLDNIQQDTVVYHAGTKLEGDNTLTNGGRVLGVTSVGDTLEQAIDKAYKSAEAISFTDSFYRKDIGKTAR